MTLLLSMPGGTEWFLIFIVLGITIIPAIFYLMTLQSTLDTISMENRKMPSGNVWLLLIPLFNLVWHFIVVKNIADSIKAEADSKGIMIAELKPAYNIGLAMCILSCLNLVPVLSMFTGIAAMVCWIIYWVKIADYKRILVRENMTFIGTIN